MNNEQIRTSNLENVEEVSGLTESGEVEEPPVVSGTQPTSNTLEDVSMWALEELTQAEEGAEDVL